VRQQRKGQGTTGAPATVRLAIDATADAGPAEQRAQGFLHGISDSAGGHPGTSPAAALVGALKPRWWRVQMNNDVTDDKFAQAQGTAITAVVSDAWIHNQARPDGSVPTPWSNWDAYRSWVTRYVQGARFVGAHVDYWDVQNEPGYAHLLAPQDRPTVTVANLLQQYLVTYQAIKTADPQARVIGPSLDAYRDRGQGSPMDLPTFLDFSAGHGLHFDALSWHENADATKPEDIVSHVAAARRLLQARPSLGQPPIFINEYGAQSTHLVPGWAVGYIAALETANVDQANRSCWSLPNNAGSECYGPTLDGLLTTDGAQPLGVYWVAASYAAMGGRRLPITTTSDSLSGFATRQPSTGAISLLLGRHVSCVAQTNPYCRQSPSATPGLATAMVTVKVGTQTPFKLTADQIPDLPAPYPTLAHLGGGVIKPAADGTISFPLPGFADGEAYFINLEPSP
jgi:hypothetical protein